MTSSSISTMTFYDDVCWATVSLTTVGYGDIDPVTVMWRVITMLSSVLGNAIVALPAGIITAGYMSEIQKARDDEADISVPVCLGKSQVHTLSSSQTGQE